MLVLSLSFFLSVPSADMNTIILESIG